MGVDATIGGPAMGMIEVDLIDESGPTIVSVAQADADLWVSIAAQANQDAANVGFSFDTGPLFNKPERTITSLVDVHNWLASNGVGYSVKAPTSPQAMSTGQVVALVVGGVSLATLAYLALRAVTAPR
jgi:hypothetical protein